MLVLLFIFFFKQKTAYEMRISDWSSDVCSSDLLFDLDSGTRSYLQSFDPNVDDDPYDFRTGFDTPGFISKGSSTESLKTDWTIGDLGPIHDLHAVLIGGYSKLYINQLNDLDVSPADQIGRASCRERVCQYV